ncbi:MAG: outer membrane protein assembly factor BamA [Acidobacteria bacterium]|nr:outer membrane protein assembly factor BamA [Acidobacteriota bacterium]MCB9398128.1 outer membrane protein assembly factor BamA [Acidobacteriota bacterium]
MRQLTLYCFGCLLALSSHLYSQELIEKIQVYGNTRVPSDAVIHRMNSQVGKTVDETQITKDLKSLWNMGLFENLGIQKEVSASGGVVLTVIVKELPLIAEVDYRGYSKVGKSSITDKIEEQHLTIKEDEPLDFKKINAIRNLIKGLLDEKGLRYGKVDFELEPLKAKGTARAVFNIREGSKVHIYKIDFEGNKVFSDAKLRRIMRKTKEHWFLSWLTQHDILKQEKFDEDLEKVKKKYWALGYKDVLIGEPDLQIEDKTTAKQKAKNEKRLKKLRPVKEDLRLFMTIPVFEGHPYHMGDVSFEGNTVLPEAFYRNSFPLRSQDVYDLGKINEWITNLEELHNNTGYLNYSIRQDVSVREGQIVDVKFQIFENDQIYLNRLSFAGNITTRDKVLRREALIREGDVFRFNNFKNSMLRINQLGFFDVSHDNPDVKPLPNENKVNVTIKGQESGVNELNFGIGYSDYRGQNGFFSFSTLNFLGRGETLKVQAQLGRFTDTYDLTFVEPWLFDKPRGFSARLFNTRSQFLGFQQEQQGFDAGLRFRPFTFTTYSISYGFSEINIPTVSSAAFQPIDDLLTSSVSQSLVYDTTDHPFFPTRGRRISNTLELAGWQTGGDTLFYKYSLGLTQYFKAYKKTFFGVNLKGSILETFEDQKPVFYELFYSGGEESVRGYERASLGPTVISGGREVPIRGDKLFQFNLEYIVPVSDQFRFVLFYDAGQVFGLDEDWFDTDLAMSTGLEMRFSLPVFQAPLRLIYAYKLVELPNNEKGGEPKFSIGTTF